MGNIELTFMMESENFQYENAVDLESLERKPITQETIEWEPILDTTLPIDEQDIPDFKAWVNWNDANIDRSGAFRPGHHQGVDLAAYLTTNNEIVFGLPPDTPVRAVADGHIDTITTEDAGYNGWVRIEHGKPDCKMQSVYRHVVPKENLKKGAVKKGEIIGSLYIDEPRTDGSGRLVHLHLELLNGCQTPVAAAMARDEDQLVSPLDILAPALRKHTASPQENINFTVPGLERTPIKVANFQKVLVNERVPAS